MSKKTFRLSLQSTHEESEKIPDFVSALQPKAFLSEEETSTLMLLLSEAVTNAIKHGNKYDPAKKVEVEIEVNQTIITSTVSDEGDGFDPTTSKDPLKEENLLEASGRGIFFLEQFSEELEYLNGGRVIRFTIKRG